MPLIIYADGACSGNPGPAGSAILILKVDGGRLVEVGHRGKSIGHGTNQIAEIVAASMAIQAAIEMDGVDFTVRCDSEYVVKGINEWMANWVKNGWRNASKKPVANKDHWLGILDDLNSARGAGKDIRFEWVRGHSTDPHNNRVDEIAVAASKLAPGTILSETTSAAAPEPRADKKSDEIREAVRDLCDGTGGDDPARWTLSCSAADVIALVERFSVKPGT